MDREYVGEFVRGELEGYGVMTYTSGDTYRGHWKQSLFSGEGQYKWKATQNSYLGQWYQGKRDGQGRFTWSSGRIYEGLFKKGRMRG